MPGTAGSDLNRLLEIIADISEGRYPDDIMDLTGPQATEPVRTIAEADAFDAITAFVPSGPAAPCALKEAAASSWSGSGGTQAEVVVLDAMTNEVIAAAVDERATALKEKFIKWGTAEDAFCFWAQRLRAFMDQAHAESQT